MNRIRVLSCRSSSPGSVSRREELAGSSVSTVGKGVGRSIRDGDSGSPTEASFLGALTSGELCIPSVPRSLTLWPVGTVASALPGSLSQTWRWRALPQEELSNVLLCPFTVRGYCYFLPPGPGSGGPRGLRVTHSGLSCPSVSEGQSIPPSSSQEENPRPP